MGINEIMTELPILLNGLFVSFFISGTICYLTRSNLRFGWNNAEGPQKVHLGVTPRIGGAAVSLGVFTNLCLVYSSIGSLFLLLAIIAAPVLIAGIVEDLTGAVTAKSRLAASVFSGALFCILTGYQITNFDISALNEALTIPIVAFVLTSLAIATMVNALNIIDGLNGLACVTAILALASFGFLSRQFGDTELEIICFSILFPSLGFLVWNFPFGKIFLGDCGAYLLGCLVAALAVLLPERNPQISPFFSLLLVLYPCYELARSTIRRFFKKNASAFEPDNKHLHSLIFQSVQRQTQKINPIHNSLASAITMILPSLCCFWALSFPQDRFLLLLGIFAFIILYETAIRLAILFCNRA